MEILKKGNVERKWKYTCEVCGCEFVLDVLDMTTTPTNFCGCPACGNYIKKDTGKLYEQLPYSMLKEEDLAKFLEEKAIYKIKEREKENG